MDQSENAVDLEISRQIRESVVSDASLSFGARNCAIITRDRVVTLRGDVTGAEETTLLHHAWATANVIRVVDDLNVTR
jgi:osmotically-inducible protein OsmY